MKRKNRRLPVSVSSLAVASVAAGCTLGLALAGAGAVNAQQPSGAAVPAAPAPAETAAPTTPDGLAYDTYFEPFLDRPDLRLKTASHLPPAQPLFPAYNPLDGLDVNAATSRVTNPGRAIIELPVIDAKVGDTVSVPLYKLAGPNITALIFRVAFEGGIVEAVDAVRPDAWKTASLTVNNRYTGETPERIMSMVEYAPEAFTENAPLLTMHFKALKPGEVELQPEHIDMADDSFNSVRLVFRNGLIRVHP